MRRSHKIEIYPNKDQQQKLVQAMGVARHVFNQAYFQFKGKNWSLREARALARELREIYPWYCDVSAEIVREALRDLDDAYTNFFRRLRQGVRPSGFPQPAKLGKNDRFRIRDKAKFRVEGRLLFFEKFNRGRGCKGLRLRELPRWANPTQMTISREGGRFFVSFGFEVEQNDKSELAGAVGLDLGVKNLVVTSDGQVFEKLAPLNKSIKRLRRRQRKLSRKVTGSKRHAKAKLAVQKLHRRVSLQRKDAIHKITSQITKSYKQIFVEDLSVSGMLRQRFLSRAIADAGLYEFRRQLEYKAASSGCELVKVDRWFPSSKACSSCGFVKDEMPLNVRTFDCAVCGSRMDRDANAALNIKNFRKWSQTDKGWTLNHTCQVV